jgi:hypothetical protein
MAVKIPPRPFFLFLCLSYTRHAYYIAGAQNMIDGEVSHERKYIFIISSYTPLFVAYTLSGSQSGY